VAAANGIDEEILLGLLANLVDKSLVVVQSSRGPARYVLLETLRSYGREQLALRGVETGWRDAHARYYLDLVELARQRLISPDEPEWVARLTGEMDNFREARRYGLNHDVDLAVRLVVGLYLLWRRTLQTELELWAEETAALAGSHWMGPLLLGGAAMGAWTRGE